MKADNKGAGEDMRFIFWDDVGDSQDHVDNQKPSCPDHDKATEEEERLAEERMMIIIRNGNEGSHYPEYNDKEDKQ